LRVIEKGLDRKAAHMNEFTGAIDCFDTFFDADCWLDSRAEDCDVKLAVSMPRLGRWTFSRLESSSRGVFSGSGGVFWVYLGVFCSSASSGFAVFLFDAAIDGNAGILGIFGIFIFFVFSCRKAMI